MPVLDSPPLALQRSGLVEYEDALAIQRSIHSEVSAGNRPNTLILLEHPSIYTAGKRTLAEERPGNGAKVLDVGAAQKAQPRPVAGVAFAHKPVHHLALLLRLGDASRRMQSAGVLEGLPPAGLHQQLFRNLHARTGRQLGPRRPGGAEGGDPTRRNQPDSPLH